MGRTRGDRAADASRPQDGVRCERGRVVLFGGEWGSTLYADTWEWDGAAWLDRQITGPAGRYAHTMAFDSVRNRVVLFGGMVSGGSAVDDTWEYDGTAWTQKMPVHHPAARWEHGSTFHAGRKRMVLFGGYVSNSADGGTWEWDGTDWKLATSEGPYRRAVFGITYDAKRDVAVLFGGFA